MSAHAVITEPAPIRELGKPQPTAIPRQPSAAARELMRAAAQCLLQQGFDYREIMALARSQVTDVALEQAGRSRKKASARLKISRELLRRYRSRAPIGL